MAFIDEGHYEYDGEHDNWESTDWPDLKEDVAKAIMGEK